MDVLLGWSCSASLFPCFSRGLFFSVLPECFGRAEIFALCTPNQAEPSQSSWDAGSEPQSCASPCRGSRAATEQVWKWLSSALHCPVQGQWGQSGTQDTSALPWLETALGGSSLLERRQN